MSGEKKTDRIDIPKCVRTDALLGTKLRVVAGQDNRKLADQVRDSLTRGVDARIHELELSGKKVMDQVCREMSASREPVENPSACGPKPALSANVGFRRAVSA